MTAELRSTCRALVCLAAAATAGSALAQSNVTIYGRVVGGVEYIDKILDDGATKTHSNTRAASNQWGTSMLGFKGAEDLGGGLRAEFLLESGFSSTNGTTNGPALFNRRAYVGLSSTSLGTLHLGKNLLISNDVWYLDPTGQQFISTATLVRGRNWQGAVNVIEYVTPNLGGFSLYAQVGLGEGQGASKRLRTEGFSASYAAGDLELRAIYNVRHDAAGAFSDVYLYSRDTVLGGTYRFGPAKMFAGYEMVSAPDATATAPSKLKHGWLGVRYDLSSALTLIGALYNNKANRVDGKATLLMVGADYSLSKRTLLYASLGGVSNKGGGNYAADLTVNGPGVNASQRAFYTGMSHSF
jgi:predicted porin